MERSFFVTRKSIIYLMTARQDSGILMVGWAIDLMGRYVSSCGEVENWVLSISFAPAVGGLPEINHCQYNRTKTDTLAKGQYHTRA